MFSKSTITSLDNGNLLNQTLDNMSLDNGTTLDNNTTLDNTALSELNTNVCQLHNSDRLSITVLTNIDLITEESSIFLYFKQFVYFHFCLLAFII